MSELATILTDRQISFCVPVYNVAPYIEDCIRSILFLRDKGINFEIICVEDASSDSSLEILEELAKQRNKSV